MASELSPYRGLAAFGESDLDSQLFFGRERETEIVAANLAGLASDGAVRRQRSRQELAARARESPITCGAQRPAVPITSSSCARAGETIRSRRCRRPPRRPCATRSATCPSWRTSSRSRIGSRPGRAALDGEIYLVLDQVEEYLLYHGAGGGGPLAGALADIVTRPSLRVGVLLGIRDDALAQLDTLKARIPGLFGNLLRLDHLTREEGRHAIVGPLAAARHCGGSRRARRSRSSSRPSSTRSRQGRSPSREGRGIVAEREDGGRIEAPFLQLVMERLWDVERERGSSTLHAATLVGARRRRADRRRAPRERPRRALRRGAGHCGGRVLVPRDAVGHQDRAQRGRSRAVLRDRGGDGAAGARAPRSRSASSGRSPIRVVAAQTYEIFHDVLADSVLAWSARSHGAARARTNAARGAASPSAPGRCVGRVGDGPPRRNCVDGVGACRANECTGSSNGGEGERAPGACRECAPNRFRASARAGRGGGTAVTDPGSGECASSRAVARITSFESSLSERRQPTSTSPGSIPSFSSARQPAKQGSTSTEASKGRRVWWCGTPAVLRPSSRMSTGCGART